MVLTDVFSRVILLYDVLIYQSCVIVLLLFCMVFRHVLFFTCCWLNLWFSRGLLVFCFSFVVFFFKFL